MSKLEAFSYNIFYVTQKKINFLIEREENIVEREENTDNQYLFLFLQSLFLFPPFIKLHKWFSLTLYHTIPTFNDPKKESFWKHCGKWTKCWLPAFFPFATMFSTLSKTYFSFWATFSLSSANALNLDSSKIVSFGKEFKTISFLYIIFKL